MTHKSVNCQDAGMMSLFVSSTAQISKMSAVKAEFHGETMREKSASTQVIESDSKVRWGLTNELHEIDAKKLLDNGCRCVTEVANMPVTDDGMKVLLKSDILYSPSKASNAAGVACSGLEMAQNSSKIRWTPEEVDQRLRTIMKDIHDNCLEAAERFGDKGNYFFGANIAGFLKVANAMIDQGNT